MGFFTSEKKEQFLTEKLWYMCSLFLLKISFWVHIRTASLTHCMYLDFIMSCFSEYAMYGSCDLCFMAFQHNQSYIGPSI